MLKALFVIFSLLIFASCQQGPKGSAESPSIAIYNESEFAKDYQSLQQTEQALNTVGLKFKRVENSPETVSYVWDSDSLQGSASNGTQKVALQGFVDAVELFLRKYSQPFYVNLSDEKSTLFRQIKEPFKAELLGKLFRAKSYLGNL